MNLSYLEKLILEYKRVYGVDKFDYYNNDDFRKFNEWLLELKTSSNRYRRFILSSVLKNLDDVIEFSKGEHDTITNCRDSSILVTPYASSIKNIGSRQIISGDAYVSNEVCLQLSNNKGQIVFNRPTAFLFQNPSNKDSSLGYTLIKHGYPVIMGIHGFIFDQDFKTKTRNLETILDTNPDLEVIERTDLETQSVAVYTKKLIK